eukprot:5062980-Prymnesium_polylepis.1
MLSENKRAITSVMVKESVEGYSLNHADFVRLSISYPSFREWLSSVVRLRLANTVAGRTLMSDGDESAPKAAGKMSAGTRVNLQALINANSSENSVTRRASLELKAMNRYARRVTTRVVGARARQRYVGARQQQRARVGAHEHRCRTPVAADDATDAVQVASGSSPVKSSGDAQGGFR